MMTREQATFALARNRYGSEAPALLDLADRFPGTWHYTADRHRAVVKYMPSGDWLVVDCEESEERIKALARGRRP
jgi:hypothetical protein